MKLIKSAHISAKFKTTIPKEVSAKLGLLEGDIIGFYENSEGKIVLKRIPTEAE